MSRWLGNSPQAICSTVAKSPPAHSAGEWIRGIIEKRAGHSPCSISSPLSQAAEPVSRRGLPSSSLT